MGKLARVIVRIGRRDTTVSTQVRGARGGYATVKTVVVPDGDVKAFIKDTGNWEKLGFDLAPPGVPLIKLPD